MKNNIVSLCEYRENKKRKEIEELRSDLIEFIYKSEDNNFFEGTLFLDGKSTGITVPYPYEIVQNILKCLEEG